MTTTTDSNIFAGLNTIADSIEKLEGQWLQAWKLLDDKTTPGEDAVKNIQEATATLNSEIDRHVDEVAKITNNSVQAIRQSYHPKDWSDVWFGRANWISPSNFLRKVAQHRSFNVNYWAESERKQACESLRAQALSDDDIKTPDQAAQEISVGGIPHVAQADALRNHNSLSKLEEALLASGILEPYDKAHKDRISATKNFAFITRDADGNREFCFWPSGLAANHIDRQDMNEPQAPTDAMRPTSRA